MCVVCVFAVESKWCESIVDEKKFTVRSKPFCQRENTAYQQIHSLYYYYYILLIYKRI